LEDCLLGTQEDCIMAGNQRPRLAFESLESKQLLAGDVTVSLVGGTLRIVGDDAANQVAVTPGAEAGEFVIQGLEGTVVHLEGAEDPAPVAGLEVAGVRSMQVRLGDGADELSVNDAELRGSLLIDAGAGDDEVTLSDVSVRGLLHVAAGAGNDTVTLGVAEELETPAATLAGRIGNGGFNNADASVKAGAAIDVVLGDGDDTLAANSVAADWAPTMWISQTCTRRR
jgi:hypothetical protein